jgi:hypothetical protein
MKSTEKTKSKAETTGAQTAEKTITVAELKKSETSKKEEKPAKIAKPSNEVKPPTAKPADVKMTVVKKETKVNGATTEEKFAPHLKLSDVHMKVSDIIKARESGNFNYLFEIDLNRKLSTTHVHQLEREISELYPIIGSKAVTPFYVLQKTKKGKMASFVIDGQHKMEACINIFNKTGLDMDVVGVAIDGDAISTKDLVKVVSTFNASPLKWTNLNYVDVYSKMKVKGYARLKELLTSGDSKDFITALAPLYTGLTDSLSIATIRSGKKLNEVEGNIRREQFTELAKIIPEQRRQSKILKVMSQVICLPEYNHEKFVTRFKTFVQKSYFPKSEEDLYNKMVKLLQEAA